MILRTALLKPVIVVLKLCIDCFARCLHRTEWALSLQYIATIETPTIFALKCWDSILRGAHQLILKGYTGGLDGCELRRLEAGKTHHMCTPLPHRLCQLAYIAE